MIQGSLLKLNSGYPDGLKLQPVNVTTEPSSYLEVSSIPLKIPEDAQLRGQQL